MKFKLFIASLLAVLAAGFGVSPAHASDASLAASIHIPNVGQWAETKAPGKWRFEGDSKKSPAPTPFTGPGYYHAGAAQVLTGTNTAGGLSGKLYVGKPFIPSGSCVTNGDHSLMELAIKDTAGNVVEVGWAEEPTAFGDCKPRLFASTWIGNGSGGSTWNNCYDAHSPSCSFSDNSSNPIDLGSDLTSTASLCNGSSLACVKTFQAYFSTTNCGPAASGIFITYDGVSVGCYYSTAFYNHITPSAWTTFQGFGEYYYSGATKPCGDMGNGVAPTTALGNTGPAYVGSVSLANPNPGTLATSFSSNASTDGPAYDVAMATGNRTFATSGAGYTGTPPGTPGTVNGC